MGGVLSRSASAMPDDKEPGAVPRLPLKLQSPERAPLASELSVRVDIPDVALSRAGASPVWRVYVELDVAHTRARALLLERAAHTGPQTLVVAPQAWMAALRDRSGETLCNIATVYFRLCGEGRRPDARAWAAATGTPTTTRSSHEADEDALSVDEDNRRGRGMDASDGDGDAREDDDGCVAIGDLVMDVFYELKGEVPPSDPALLTRRVFGLHRDEGDDDGGGGA